MKTRTEIKRKTELRKVSAKKLAAVGGKVFSTFTAKPGTKKPSRSSSRSSGTKTGMMRRKSGTKRKPRPESETVRAHGPAERREWTKRQPCIVPGCGRTPCDAAHLINGGTGRKADAKWTVPFCSTDVRTGYEGHHAQYDGGKQSFLAKHFPGMEREEIAAPVEAAWQAEAEHLAARSQGGDSR